MIVPKKEVVSVSGSYPHYSNCHQHIRFGSMPSAMGGVKISMNELFHTYTVKKQRMNWIQSPHRHSSKASASLTSTISSINSKLPVSGASVCGRKPGEVPIMRCGAHRPSVHGRRPVVRVSKTNKTTT